MSKVFFKNQTHQILAKARNRGGGGSGGGKNFELGTSIYSRPEIVHSISSSLNRYHSPNMLESVGKCCPGMPGELSRDVLESIDQLKF